MDERFTSEHDTKVLATDLDGTLLPLAGNRDNEADLATLVELIEREPPTLIYATGRRLESALHAIETWQLPQPHVLICDTGTVFCTPNECDQFVECLGYKEHVRQQVADFPISEFAKSVEGISDLHYRSPENQNEFKLALTASANALHEVVREIEAIIERLRVPFVVAYSIDVDTGEGLIDIVPKGAAKGNAIKWWADQSNTPIESILFAGDSGNDLDALTAGFRSVVVGNAQSGIANAVHAAYGGSSQQVFLADRFATSGLLDGCRWFELFRDHSASTGNRVGATPVTFRQTHFRVWAPKHREVSVEIKSHDREHAIHTLPKAPNAKGYFEGTLSAKAGDKYSYILNGQTRRPDPATRCQPHGVHRDSRIVHAQFPWTDSKWKGVPKSDLIVYELHIGAFTEQGTFRAAIARLPELVELGVTAIELLPVAQSPGKWNWGYDGVNLFAPRNTFGSPDDFRALVGACHDVGLAVILDVVYNHLGPEGNYLAEFGRYYSRKHRTPWGEAFDFDGRNARNVRDYIVQNAIYWLRDFHLDGLRLDAVHFMFDDSDYTILDEIRDRVAEFRAKANREIHLIAEANIFDKSLAVGDATSDRDPYCACWCDDIMHSVYALGTSDVKLTHRSYNGCADLHESLTHGFIYTGPTVTRIDSGGREQLTLCSNKSYLESLIVALQTHDSVGNHPHGKRIHQLTSVEFQKAAAVLFMLYPAIPMMFMGEEFASESPFPFFVDFEDRALRKRVDRGRAAEYPQHQWRGAVSPSDPKAFHSAKCHDSSIRDESVTDWYRQLISLRKRLREDQMISSNQLTVSADVEANYFMLNYARDQRTISVHVRLEGTLEQIPDSHSISVTGKVLLDSNTERSYDGGIVELAKNEALVVISENVRA
ncbi:MAG: malto-oligosyltrehalose trehalohydrolase [Planctomycetales bacterium]|nr:malto-oligosyltrehalose trehalohydrolase [Planctomycetales bacterium]